jgi:phosphoribosylaminoimidazole-succinocarboxamide synthase
MVIAQTNYPNLLYRGKVRDTYDLGKGLLLMIATDRISAFDVVLPTAIPHKGLVLSALSAFWFHKTAHIVANHLVGLASEPEVQRQLVGTLVSQLPKGLARQAMVVKKAQRINVECIVRGYIAGSAWAEYRTSGTACGIKLPAGLKEGSRLAEPLFTPTTKAEKGHDVNMSYSEVERLVGKELARQLKEKSLEVYRFAHEYALPRGIILADTKMEFGLLNGQLILIDELLTPDSSRFWDAASYSPGRSQPNYDKQFVRDWLIESGWNKEPPAPGLPQDVVQKTAERYLEAYRRLTGRRLELEED